MEKYAVAGAVRKIMITITVLTAVAVTAYAMNKKKNCVQCGKEMVHSYGNGDWAAPFCSVPECPNFELLQTGVSVAEQERQNEIQEDTKSMEEKLAILEDEPLNF